MLVQRFLARRIASGNAIVTYLPPFKKIRAMVTIDGTSDKPRVTASYEDFLGVIRAMLTVIDVDEAWYLAAYPDVASGIKKGTVKSAQDHFVHNGYFEGRMPFPMQVDERWYLTENPIVADYIKANRLASGQQHFDHNGYKEGLLPFPL